MAAGDEKIDVFDQVHILNRLSDAPVEIMFDGKSYKWRPRETRSIPRAYSVHFLHKSTFKWDPTEAIYPRRTLVEVDDQGVPVEAAKGATAEPLTLADSQVLDLLDETNLPPDRYTATDGDGNVVVAGRKEFRSTGIKPTSGAPAARRLDKGQAEWNRPEGRDGLEEAADAAAQAKIER